jgi:hypothetical protein
MAPLPALMVPETIGFHRLSKLRSFSRCFLSDLPVVSVAISLLLGCAQKRADCWSKTTR